MSLINQMLQDLDARRSETTGSGPFGQQVRAVPERRRVHPAWWIALLLAGVLSGVLAWILLRPPVATPMPSAGVRLPLKLDIDLNVAAQAPLASIPQEERTVDLATAQPTVAEPDKPADVIPADNPAPAPVVIAENRALAEKSSVPARVAKEAPVPELAKVVPAAKSLVTVPSPKLSEPVAPALVKKQVKELTPKQLADNEYRKAVLSIQHGKPSEAIGSLELVLQLDPQHTAARQTLIAVLVENKRQDEALLRAREGLAINPSQPELAMILARLQLEKRELQPAIETLERTLSYAADRADYQAFLAALLQRDERHKQAVEHYLLALQRAPQNGVWWMGLGISLQAERRITDAQEAFKRAKATNGLSAELLAFVDARLNQLQR